jgi:DNA uptake protein ComE-like DNA-binding protein
VNSAASDESLLASTVATSPIQSESAPSKTLLNINTATPRELAALPTIDEAMAEQIISNRPYETLEDLILNQGFGPMKLRRISPFVTVE